MNLDNLSFIKKMDPQAVAESIANFSQQLESGYTTAKKNRLPASYLKYDQIIVCGMGGSNLASEIIKRIFIKEIKIPLALVRGYHLPGFVSPKTLVIISSYSGNTEETLSCLVEAIQAKAKIICLTGGGQLAQIAKKKKLPLFLINPEFNPSNQPRYDLGSQLGMMLLIFKNIKAINLSDKQIVQTIKELSDFSLNFIPAVSAKKNPAKQLSHQLTNKQLFLIGAEHLLANTHILTNQINESAKQLAMNYQIPELNHHFLEALEYPTKIQKQTAFIFLYSHNYSENIKKRFSATQKLIAKKKIANFVIKLEEPDKLKESLKLLTIGSWISFYLAMINKVNPAKIPWVDWFKKELAK